MANAVFIQNPQSIYKDRPGEAYHFPKKYLGMVRECIGDWVIFYEGKSGRFGYVSVQKLRDVTPDPDMEDHYFAWLERGTEWSFETIVPRADPSGAAFEESLRGPDGKPTSGGVNVSAVRRLTPREFSAIVNFGLRPVAGPLALSREATTGFAEEALKFETAPLQFDRPEQLMSRKLRDASFARQVKAAYGGRCAISGLGLRNGGGRSEVQAAHIRPVSHDGPDTVQNGLALSGTLHWMFDRGLVSVGEDLTILVSHNKVPSDVAQRLIAPGLKLMVPEDPRLRPHPEYLQFHREHIFGQAA
jgi:putative restriction endonuclease